MSERFSFEEEPPPQLRGRVVVQAVFYSLCTVVCFAVVYIGLAGGYWVMMGLFGLIGLLTAIQARHYLLDIRAQPVILEGEVQRKWIKGNVMIPFLTLFPSYYILVVDRDHFILKGENKKVWSKIFTVSRAEFSMLLETDLVRVTCYPHSLTVQRMERYDESEKKFIPAASGASV